MYIPLLLMKAHVDLCDVSPRDGDQTDGISMSHENKLWFVETGRRIGLAMVEAGYAGSNDIDQKVFQHLRDHPPGDFPYSAFGRTRLKNRPATDDAILRALVESGAPIITLFGKSCRSHVHRALETTEAENLAMISDSFAFLRSERPDARLHFDAEHFFDGWAEDADYALQTLTAAVSAGVRRLILCDTKGYSRPEFIKKAVEQVCRAFHDCVIGVHLHNDRGLADEGVLAAVEAGARHVDCTWNELGERGRNANLATAIGNLHLERYGTIPETNLPLLTQTARAAARQVRMAFPAQPFVGRNAYAHKGGGHASAVAKDPSLYEGSPPETWGNRRTIVGSKQAGLSNVRALVHGSRMLPAETKSVILDDREAQGRILTAIEAKENQGFCMDHADASLELLMLRALGEFKPQICILSSEVLSKLSVHDPGAITAEMRNGGEKSTRAIVSVRVNGDTKAFDTVANDDGPIGALCEALFKALKERFPFLPQTVRLLDYHLAKSDKSEEGTHSVVQVTVLWTDGDHEWATTGVSSNSIDAGWQAVVDAMEYKVQLERRSDNSAPKESI